MEEIEMSTRIDDLPGSIPNKMEEETKRNIINQEIEKTEKLSIEIPEKVSIFNFIKREINEENLFLLILFFILSISDTNKYIGKIPYIGMYYGEESWTFTIIKSIIFLSLFIIGKLYILPKIQI